jgi:hypothetical protein
LTDLGVEVLFADFPVWEYALADNIEMTITNTNTIL